MTKLFLLCAAFLASVSLSAQTYSQTFNLCDKTYTATCEQLIGGKVKITVVDANKDSAGTSINIVTTDLEQFAKSFKGLFATFNTANNITCPVHDADTSALVFGRQLFLNFQASMTKDSTVPVAGVFKIKDSVAVQARMRYFFYNIGQPKTLVEREVKHDFKRYKIDKVNVEFNNGFMENIKAYITVDSQQLIFTNAYPFGISSVSNFKSYNGIELYEMNSRVYMRHIHKSTMRAAIKDLEDTYKIDSMQKKQPLQRGTLLKGDSSFAIKLGDLVDYDYALGVDRRDYSPKNDTLTLKGSEARILHKEATNRLFEAHIYTDFIGLNEDKPNGLIQTEVSKRININTLQHLSNRWFYWLARSRGGFQYIEPSITLSKLEQHNKRLMLGDMDSIRYNPGSNDTSKFGKKHRYTNALDLYQYQTFSGGVDVNIGFLNNHDLKFTVYLNAGARLGITSVSDSLTSVNQNVVTKTGQVKNYSINTFQFYPSLIATFLPEERFNLSLKYQLMYIKVLNSDVQPLAFDKQDETKVLFKNIGWLNMLELLMTIQVNSNSKMFGRIKFNSDLHNAQRNFAQVQVGYSTFILGGKP